MPKPKIRYTLAAEPEAIEVKGNAMASGDDLFDKATEDQIIQRLDVGDLWAWCFVKVTASVEFEGQTFEGIDTLGACSYANEADFCQPGGYWDDMQANALDDLRVNLAGLSKRGNIAAALLRLLLHLR